MQGTRSGREVLGSALDTTAGALESYISDCLAGRLATQHWTELLELKDQQEGRRPRRVASNDLVAQVRIMTTRFPEMGHLFELDRAQLRFLGELRDARNAWAHGEEFLAEDLTRSMDTMVRLLRSIGAEAEAHEISVFLSTVTSEPEVPVDRSHLDREQSDAASANGKGTAPLESVDVTIDMQHLKSINFASIQSAKTVNGGRNIVQQISLTSSDAGAQLFTLSAQLFSAVGPLSESVERVIDLSMGEVVIPDIDVSPDAAKFLALDTRQSGFLLVQLRQDAELIAERRSDVELLPANHWQGARTQVSAEMLAAFIQPQHPAIAGLLSAAQDLLGKRTGSSAINAYQGEDADASAARVDEITEAVFDAMSTTGIRYSNPPASWDVQDSGGQRVRNPQEVLEGHIGTCLDTAVVLAAALEAAGINSLLWLVHGHAFMAYWRFNIPMGLASTDDFDSASSLVHADVVRVIETTAVTHEHRSPLRKASDGTRQRYVEGRGQDPAELFEYAIDVQMCRLAGIYPLPARTMSDDGSVTVTEYTPAASESLTEFFRQKDLQEVAPKPGRKVFPPRVIQWKNQLLDLSLRNRLLNFSERARFPLGIPEDAVEVFEDRVNDGYVMELVPSDHIGATDKTNYEGGYSLPASRRHDLMLKERKVYTLAEEKSYGTTLRKIAFSAKTELQESGANNLYLAIGSLVWTLADKHQRSPLILVPVNLIPGGKNGNYRVELDSSGSSTPNFCLLEKLRQEFDLEIPGLEDPEVDASGIDIKKTFESVSRALAAANLPFHVERTVDLANLQFARFRLWKDLDENWKEFAKNPLVKHLIDTPTEVFEELPSTKTDADFGNLDELAARCPVPADASQLEAVAMAAAGRTFVLEGPPGTGKSQTITNLLATAMAQGKRVLFVAEKRAALEVVQRRLAAVGLSPFTLDLHDKGSKVNDVRRQIQEALDHKIQRDEQGRSILEADLRSARRRLTKYADRLHQQNLTGMSAYSAHTQELAIDPAVVPLPVSEEFTATASIEDVNMIRHCLNELPEIADLARPVRVHPWGFLERPVADDEIAGIVKAAEELTAAITALGAEALSSEVSTIVADVFSPKLMATITDVLRAGVPAEVLTVVRTTDWQKKIEQCLRDAGDIAASRSELKAAGWTVVGADAPDILDLFELKGA